MIFNCIKACPTYWFFIVLNVEGISVYIRDIFMYNVQSQLQYWLIEFLSMKYWMLIPQLIEYFNPIFHSQFIEYNFEINKCAVWNLLIFQRHHGCLPNNQGLYSQKVLGLNVLHKSTKFKPKIWLNLFINTSSGPDFTNRLKSVLGLKSNTKW